MSITYHEIKDQYPALARTGSLVDARLREITPLLKECPQYVFIGCGSSYAVARSGALMARLRLHKPALAIPAGDLLLHMDTYRPALEGAGVVVLSRSGETSEVILAIRKIREMDAACADGPRLLKVLSVACVEGSTLATLSDLTLEMPWAFDHSVCQTRTVSCLYFLCAYMIARLSGDDRLADDLRAAVAEGPAYLEVHEPALKKIAHSDWTQAVVLGDGELSGLCEEGALAFKEICQVNSNYYHLLDARHGPMVLVDDKTLVIAALSVGVGASGRARLELDMLRDIAAKGAAVVAYSDENIALPGVLNCGFGRKMSHPARGLPVIALCQLLAYHKSFRTGANPDQPEGLSPWIALA
ncbi:MAG: SIS domain-containing protein [Clostridia bacterium]|nr:SIS domain-containing protein [Clostridia bacterium]